MIGDANDRVEFRAHQAMCVREILSGIATEMANATGGPFRASVVTEGIPNLHKCHFDVMVQLYVDACIDLGAGPAEVRAHIHRVMNAYLSAE